MPRDLKIYPITIDKKKLGEEEVGKVLPQIPHLILAVGKVRSGKTLMYNNLYLSDRFYGQKFDIRILLSPSAHNDAVNKHLIDEFDMVFTEITEDLIEEILDLIKNDESDSRYLMVFDDVIGAITQKKTGRIDLLSGLATKYRHIANAQEKEGRLSIFIATQYFKHLTPVLRNNASAYLLMGAFPERELKQMGEQLSVFGGDEKKFLNIYKEAKKNPFDFLYLNMNRLEAYRNFEKKIWSGDE
jgi:hypothetical protein